VSRAMVYQMERAFRQSRSGADNNCKEKQRWQWHCFSEMNAFYYRHQVKANSGGMPKKFRCSDGYPPGAGERWICHCAFGMDIGNLLHRSQNLWTTIVIHAMRNSQIFLGGWLGV
jgi:hypothetical protein